MRRRKGSAPGQRVQLCVIHCICPWRHNTITHKSSHFHSHTHTSRCKGLICSPLSHGWLNLQDSRWWIDIRLYFSFTPYLLISSSAKSLFEKILKYLQFFNKSWYQNRGECHLYSALHYHSHPFIHWWQ